MTPRDLLLRWQEAVAARDMAFLEALLHPQFTLTTGRPGAEVRSRAEYLEITATRYELASFAFEWIEVLAEEGAAVVRSRYAQRGAMDGAPRDQAFLITDVFFRGGEHGWRAAARHSQPL